MTANDVINVLKSRGVDLWQEGSVLRYRARLGTLTDREKAALKANKVAILRALSQPTDAPSSEPVAPATAITAPLPTRTEPPEPGSTAPFNQQALDAVKAGAGCWVWSGVLEAWLFWVRDEERKAKAIRRGIDPGCIWTLEELTGVQGMPPEGLRDVAAIKRQFGGTVQPGAVPARWRDALQPLEPTVAGEVAA